MDSRSYINQLGQDVQTVEKELIPALQKLFNTVFAGNQVTAFYQGEAAESFEKEFTDRLSVLPEKTTVIPLPEVNLSAEKEAFIIPTALSFAAKGLNFKNYGYKLTGSLFVTKQLLENEYLWENIRVLGGAYGVALNLKSDGHLSVVSFRDPKPAKSLQVFSEIGDFLANHKLTDKELDKLIIGTFGIIAKPLSDVTMIQMAVESVFGQFKDEDRRRIQKEVINTTSEQIANLSELFSKLATTDHEVVLCSKRLSSELDADFTINDY